MASQLLKEGHRIFSPIAHSHPIALFGLPKEFDFWSGYAEEMISLCSEVWVLKLNGWDVSVGVQAEIKLAEKLGKPVKYIKET